MGKRKRRDGMEEREGWEGRGNEGVVEWGKGRKEGISG